VYNYDSNELNSYTTYYNNFTPNNVSFGLQVTLPFFDFVLRAKAKQTAAEALRATVEAEQAKQQNDVQIASLTGSLRELDAIAEVASLKQQIADEQLKTVLTQLELGNGAETGLGAQPQLTPRPSSWPVSTSARNTRMRSMPRSTSPRPGSTCCGLSDTCKTGSTNCTLNRLKLAGNSLKTAQMLE